MPVDRYAAFAAEMTTIPLGDAPRHAARRCVVDWFATTVPGGVRPPATLLVAALAEETGTGRARLVPGGGPALARAAALINGAAAHTVEFDDIFRDAIYHPGAPVIAAALALAEARGIGGERFLRAVISGYEVSTRIGAAMVPAHYEHWHTTGTVGTLGAAAACATLLGLDAAAAGHAIANAATMAAGLQQAFRSDAHAKPLHAGRAAEAGVLVALAAERGVTGAAHMLDGPRGLGNAMSRDVDWDAALAGLGATWNIERITQKNHGCCGHTFAALDAIIALREANRLAPGDVARIRIGTYATALEVTGNHEPTTGYEAKFSLPYCAAVALVDGRVRLAAFEDARRADPALRAVMDRVELHVDTGIDAAFPRRRAAVVEIETGDGRVLRHEAPTRKGDPENPLTDAELVAKYRELTVPVLGEPAAEGLLDAIWRIDVLDDMATLPLAAPTPGGVPARREAAPPRAGRA